jgi:hypothetical protein
MTLLDALREVGKFYIPGTVAFFEKFDPDPWLDAHRVLEQAAFLPDEELQSAAAESHVARCRELVELYRRQGGKAVGMPSVGDYAFGSPSTIQKAKSRRAKACWKCGTTAGVGLVADPADKAGVLIACPKHRNVKAEREFDDIEGATP